MTCTSCIDQICTNRCASAHREPQLADISTTAATRAATGDAKAIGTARGHDVALIRAHMAHMHPGRLEYAEATIRQIINGQRRYNDESVQRTRRAA